MGHRRALLATVSILAAVGLTACSAGSSSSATTTTAASATSTSGAPSSAHGLCADITAFTTEQQGLSGGSSLASLKSYAARSKTLFDKIAPTIAKDLATAPAAVRSAWATVVPTMDRVYEAAAKATSATGFQNAGEAIESTAAYSAAKQALDNYTKTACPNLGSQA
jgi:hypothetical protein